MYKKKAAFSSGPECANCTSTEKLDGESMRTCARCGLVSYCSRNCQIQHWKNGGHRQFCVTPEERSVQAAVTSETSLALGEGGDRVCPVCLGELDTSITTLPCSHVIHTQCVNELRSFGAQSACPSCRTELPSKLDTAEPRGKKCANCGATKSVSGTLLDCSRCKTVSYCGPECQVKHWKEGGHKIICKKHEAIRLAADTAKDQLQNEEYEKELIGLLQAPPPPNKAKARRHKIKMMELIAKRTNWSVTSSKFSATSLHFAAFNGRTEYVTVLLEAGADVHHTTKDGYSPLMLAASNGHAESTTILLEAGANVNYYKDDGWTSLIIAAYNGHLKSISLLLKSGADVHHSCEAGWTSLIAAASKGHAACISLLLKAGADVNHTKDDGWTSLLIAAYNGHLKSISLLLKAGADVLHTSKDGLSLLMVAASKGHADCISFLLKSGADVHHSCEAGWTSLITAASKGHADCISLLLKAGADVHYSCEDGWTSLSLAASKGNTECTTLLLKAGADVHHTKEGESARDLAVAGKEGHWREVVMLLDAHAGGRAPGKLRYP